jgi:NAD(P)H-dependent FMN reductase
MIYMIDQVGQTFASPADRIKVPSLRGPIGGTSTPMPRDSLSLAVIIGSTREGRFVDTVGRWFAAEAARHGGLAVDLVDLAEAGLPPVHPATRSPPVERFAARLAAADAFVVVTPEYNHSFPAALKHAIDLGNAEWRAKPVGFVSYGGMAGGLRAVEHLRLVFAELHAMTVRDCVSFHTARERFDAEGRPKDPAGCAAAAKRMLDQLAWWAEALWDARWARPYAGAAA